MREKFMEQLIKLHNELTSMGYMCQKAIALAMEGLLEGKEDSCRKAIVLAKETDEAEKNVENLCLKMILQQQPVASDLRKISAGLKMVTDMERMGDQAEDIAEIALGHRVGDWPRKVDLEAMSKEAISMVHKAVKAYVDNDLDLAKEVMAQDDVVDQYFETIQNQLIGFLAEDKTGAYIVDVLMVAKYLERIGDHAVNVAEWVEYAVTGAHKGHPDQLPLC